MVSFSCEVSWLRLLSFAVLSIQPWYRNLLTSTHLVPGMRWCPHQKKAWRSPQPMPRRLVYMHRLYGPLPGDWLQGAYGTVTISFCLLITSPFLAMLVTTGTLLMLCVVGWALWCVFWGRDDSPCCPSRAGHEYVGVSYQRSHLCWATRTCSMNVKGPCQSLCAELDRRRVDLAHLACLERPHAACDDFIGRYDGRERPLSLACALLKSCFCGLDPLDWMWLTMKLRCLRGGCSPA